MCKPWCIAIADCPNPGSVEGAGQIKNTAPGWACQHCCWANSDKLVARETNNSRDEGLKRRKGEILFWVSTAGGRWQSQALTTNISTCMIETQNLIRRGSRGYVLESRQRACDHEWGSECVQPMIMGREGVVWGMVFQAFYCCQGFSGLVVFPVIAKHLHQCLKKVQ